MQKLGHEVTVYEKDSYASMGTSYANGGQLSVSNAEVWNKPSTIIKGMKWLFQNDAPLLVNLKPSFHKLSWFTQFILQMPNYEQNTRETVKLALKARDYLFDIADKENIEFDLLRKGILHIYSNKKSLKHARALNTLLNSAGLERHEVSAVDINNIESSLTGKYIGGFFTESDSTGDIFKFTTGLETALGNRVKFKYDVDVFVEQRFDKFFINGDRHDHVVICAGVRSNDFAKQFGDRLNIYPVKGYSITIPNVDIGPEVSILDDDAKIVTSRLGNRLRVAGTAEFNGYNRDIRADRIEPLLKWTKNNFNHINLNQYQPWAGLRPMTPTMLPKVGPGSQQGIWYNTGHGHLGWTLSAATANIVATMINESEET